MLRGGAGKGDVRANVDNAASNVKSNANKAQQHGATTVRDVTEQLKNVLPTPAGVASRSMSTKTFLKYQAGALGETSLLLGVLTAARHLQSRIKNPDAVVAFDCAAWALVVFGSDAIVGVLRRLAVRLGWAAPRGDLQENLDPWYKALSKPRWTPRNWVFPVVWIPLKLLQVYAATHIWVAPSVNRDVLNPAVVLFCAHQALGDLWNTAFFRERHIKGGLVIIYEMYAALLATTFAFGNIRSKAGYLMAPTCAWLAVASTLNLSIHRRNRSVSN